jgi:hypothetical protein
MSGTVWDRNGDTGGPSEGMGLRRPVSGALVSESHSAVFSQQNESRFATVQSSGTREDGFHPHLGRPLDEQSRAGPNGSTTANGGGGAGRGVVMPDESGAANSDELRVGGQRAMKLAGVSGANDFMHLYKYSRICENYTYMCMHAYLQTHVRTQTHTCKLSHSLTAGLQFLGSSRTHVFGRTNTRLGTHSIRV